MKRVLLTALLAASLTACLDDPSPDQARLVVQGDAGKQVRLITSSQFVAAVLEDGLTRVVMIESDTAYVTLPHSVTYSIRTDQRFFVEAARETEDVQSLRMEVFIDARKQFDEAGPLLTGQPFRFVYAFNQHVTREIQVL